MKPMNWMILLPLILAGCGQAPLSSDPCPGVTALTVVAGGGYCGHTVYQTQNGNLYAYPAGFQRWDDGSRADAGACGQLVANGEYRDAAHPYDCVAVIVEGKISIRF